MRKFFKKDHSKREGQRPSQLRKAIAPIFEPMEARMMMSATVNAVAPAVGIESSGPYPSYMPVGQGSGTGSRSYSDIGFIQAPMANFSPNYIVNTASTNGGVNSLTLQLYNTATSGTHAPISGTFDVWVLPDNDTATGGPNPITSSQTILLGGSASTNKGLSAIGSTFGTANAASLGLTGANLVGTFTNNAASGYSTYSFPASGFGSAVASTIAADFNGYDGGAGGTNYPITLMVTVDPSSPNASAYEDWEGTYSTGTPNLQLDLNEIPLSTVSESYSIGATAAANGVTVNSTAGTADVDVTRSGNTSNPVNLNYTTTYPGDASGTVSFAAGQTTGEITVPVSSQAANSSFTVTLTGGTATSTPPGQTDNITIASPNSATVNIVGTTAATTNITTTQGNTSNADIETSGPYTGSTYAPVNGSTSNGTGSFSYLSYEVVQATPAPGETITGVNGLSLQLYNTDNTAGTNYDGHAGDFNIYYLPTAATPASPATSALTFNASTTDGIAGTTGAILLGTFSFQNQAPGYDTYSISNLSTAVQNDLVTDLNSGTDSIRLAVAPGSANFAADFEGTSYSASEYPVISLSATALANVTSTYSVGTSAAANGVTVAENNVNNVAEVDVTRSGFTGDATTVSYKTTAGTAVDGTNYTGTQSGTVTFAAGQSTAEIAIPTIDAGFSGNKTFTVTLTGATVTTQATGQNDTPSIGSPASAVVTVVGSQATGTTITGADNSTTDIEAGGPYSTTYAPVNGSTGNGTGSFSYLAYEVVEASPAATPSLYPAAGQTVNAGSLSQLSLQLYNTDSTAGTNYDGHAGDFNVYFLTTSEATAPTSGLKFSTATTDGVNGAAGALLLGTFSFSNNGPGYDYFTPATNSGNWSTVSSDIVSDLNSGTAFRLAVAPGSANFAADFEGDYSPTTRPQISLTDAVTTVQTPEAISFSSATYSQVDPATGTATATITLTRSGPTTDTASVNVTTSDGSAIAGTNYVALTNQPVNFAANSATTTFTVTVDAVNPQGGDKFLNLSLSSPSTGSSSDVGTLGSQSTATLTITDTSTAPTETLSPTLLDAADVEVNGPYTGAQIKATDLSGKYPSYGVVDFTPTTPSATITGIDSASLTVTNYATGAAGPVDFYLVSDNTSSIAVASPQAPDPHFYDSSTGIEGIGTQFGSKYLLGSYNLTDVNLGDTFTIPLGYTAAAESQLISALNNPSSDFRIVMTPENGSVDAAFTATSVGLSIKVQEGTGSTSLPAWLSSNSQATWNSATKTLTVTGPSTIIADPGSDEPNIVANGSAAVLTINPTAAAPVDVHVGGVTLTNGASIIVTQQDAPTSADLNNGEYVQSNHHTNHNVLVIGVLGAANDPTFSVDAASKLNLEDNDLVVHTGSGDNGNPGSTSNDNSAGYTELSAVESLAYGTSGGRHGGAWTGNELTSSVAAAQDSSDGLESTQLAVVNNSDLSSPFSTWQVGGASETLGANDIIVKYTYSGDFTLAGTVGRADTTVLGVYFDNGTSTNNEWAFGDMNDDGFLTRADVTAFGVDFGNGTAAGNDTYAL